MNQIDTWENEEIEKEIISEITQTNEFSTEIVRELCSDYVVDAIFVIDADIENIYYNCQHCKGELVVKKKEKLKISSFKHDYDCQVRVVKDLMVGIAEWDDRQFEFIYIPKRNKED